MKSIFPPSSAPSGASQMMSKNLRQLLIGAGALVVLVALVLYRADLQSQFRSLLGKSEPPAATTRAPVRAVRNAAAVTKKDTAVAKTAPGVAKKAASGAVVAQTGQPAPKAAANAKNASTAVPAAKGPATGAASPNAAKGSATVAASQNAAKGKAPARDTAKAQGVMREVYQYAGTGRRDPFVSLLASGELRPAISDLNLMGILYDVSGRHSIAIFRDHVNNAQYRVTNGQQLGRMRVARIKPRVVVFTIEEFGMSRQDSLVLGDTTKARAK